jgi:CRISPR system Cascade subunit CasC
MPVFVELHLLQNFVPSCLNRDDTNSPKDCEFGGFRRARISSQCLKRAVRRYFKEHRLLPAEDLGQRTKRLADEVAGRLNGKRGRDEVVRAVARLLASVKLALEEDRTQYLLFLGDREIEGVVRLVEKHWDALTKPVEEPAPQEGTPAPAKRKSAKEKKKEASGGLPKEVGAELLKALDGGGAADLALFGRMLADLPEKNIDAACQVAHAISTNRVSVEMDYFTAVDDLKPEDTAGADMIGTVEFNSACYYRYACLDLRQLAENLGCPGSDPAVRRAAGAFLLAAVRAIPTGKQNSMAAINPPSLVFAVARPGHPCNLANAFVHPVRADGERGLVEKSILALDDYWGRVTGMYGDDGARGALCADTDLPLTHLSGFRKASVAEAVEAALAHAFAGAAVPEGGA